MREQVVGKLQTDTTMRYVLMPGEEYKITVKAVSERSTGSQILAEGACVYKSSIVQYNVTFPLRQFRF